MNIRSACTDIQLLEKTPLVQSFCAYTVQQDSLMEISDITKDHRFKEYDLVTQSPYLRYYAGVPIKLNNKNAGTLCVLDRKPGKLTKLQKTQLLSIQQLLCDTVHSQSINAQQIQPLYRANRHNMFSLDSNILVHELSQPVTAMNQYLDSLLSLTDEEYSGNSKIKEPLQRIHKQMARVNQIILNHKKFINGDNDKNFTKTDINKLIQDTIIFVETELVDKNITIIKHLANHQIYTYCDQIQIQQVILNLLINSIRELNRKSSNRKIEISISNEDANFISIDVIDNGLGLNQNLFNALTVLQKIENTEGMGLGLILCKHIMENHQGKLLLIPRETGTCIRLHLPTNRKI